MSTTYYLALLCLFQSFILQCLLSAECHPEDHELCETYLTIYLETGKHNALPATIFQSDFVKFAAAFHEMSNEVCEYKHMSYPSLYYVRIDSTSTAEPSPYEFGIHLFCDTNVAQSISCCNDFYAHYLNKKSYGILVETWVKHINKGTVWQNIDIEGRTVDYFWNYKFKNSTFITPTASPTQAPLQYTVDCAYTPHYLSIICNLNPPYKTHDAAHTNGLATYERSSSLCTQLLDETSSSLQLLGFECDECNAAQCELNNVTYDEQTHEMELQSIEIWLTPHCSITVDDLITFCITLDGLMCEHISMGTVQASFNENSAVLSDTWMTLLSPHYVSSQCMVYTIYDAIHSDIGVTDTQSIQWNTNSPHTQFTPCPQSEYCTFYVGNASVSRMEQITTLSLQTVDESPHNISTKIQFLDNLAFTPLMFYAPHFVSFKPMYFTMDVLISCDDAIINLNMEDWLHTEGSIFSTKWSIGGSVHDANRNIFVNPSASWTDEDELVAFLSLGAQNVDILPSTDVLTSITNTFILTRTYGDIKAIISHGMYQYFPNELNGKTVSISLSGNEHSFDQETGTVSSQWQYLWTCHILPNGDACPVQIQNDYDEPILQFTSRLLTQDTVYLFTLQIVDTIHQRKDQTFTMLTVSPSLVQMVVSVHIEWNKSEYYVPTYHGSAAIIASIDDYIADNDNDDVMRWLYVFCFEPSLENGVTCVSLESVNTSMQYAIDPFHTLPNHQYIVHINITSVDRESMQHGMVSTIFETAAASHIYDFSISSEYHLYQSVSSDIYKALYRDSDSLVAHMDIHLLSIKSHCLHPPCTYSYFYQIQSPNHDANTRIPFYFALANGLSVSPLSGVLFPWHYDDLNILGCIHDIYGSVTCQRIEYSVSSQDNTISDEICGDYYTDITNHLLLLSKMEDTLRLAQFMTVVVFEVVDTEYKDDACIEPLIDLILQYMYEYLIGDPYFIYYPFQILQILYLLAEHNVIGSNGAIHFIQIYDIMVEEYESHQASEIYYIPYSDHDYIEWDVASVLQSISYHHSVVALLNAVDVECSPSPHSILHEDIYHSIHAISNVVTALLSQHPTHIIQHISDLIYLYARRFEFDLDAQKYRAFALNEHYRQNNNNNDNTSLETMSVSRSDIEAGSHIELQLFTFNPIYITQACFHDHDYVAKSSNEYNISSTTNVVYASMKDIETTEDANDEFITLVFSWKLSNETMNQLNTSNAFHIYCQQLNIEHYMWSDEGCQSSSDVDYILSSRYFECECVGLRSGQTYALVMDIISEPDESLILAQQQTVSTKDEIVALTATEWIVFLCLFLFLLLIGYIFPLCFVDKFAPSMKGHFQLFWVLYLYASVVLANFFMQIYLCLVGFMNGNTVWLWQMEVLFGLQCATLGVYNVFLQIIVNDAKCNQFTLLTPLTISVSNAILTAFIIVFTCLHAILTIYGSISWSLWMVYGGFLCLITLFVVYLSYYWYKGKNFSGGKPYQYTEGKRESTAIVIMIAGVLLYCLAIVNGYMAYALSNHGNDDYMRCFECIQWISLCVLAAVILMVRSFEDHARKSQSSDEMKSEMTHQIVPFTDDSENDFETSSADAHSGIIPLPDGTGHNSPAPEPPINHMKPSLILQPISNPFSSTSEFETDPFMIQPAVANRRIEEEEECDVDIANLAIHPWPTTYTTVDNTQSHLGTDALGNTMSYEPEIEMDFLAIDLPQTNTTNMESEGIQTPKSDAQLYVSAPLAVRTRVRRNKKYDAPYSPYSDTSKQDHITAIGAEEHAQNGGHYVATAAPPYSCYTANTHRRSTVDSIINETQSDPERERSRHRLDASTSSIGIFDWSTPPPSNQIREISLGRLNVNTWMDGSGIATIRSQSQRGTPIPISRRQTVNYEDEYGTGAGASINMEHTRSHSPLPLHNNDNNKMHSRHTTATSMTGTFIQPDYANIITAQNEDDHRNIMKTQNLMPVPLPKTTNHLDSNQKEIVNIFEHKTNTNENQDRDYNTHNHMNGYH